MTSRKTMNVLDLLAKIGGLFASLKSAVMIFVSMFSLQTINAQYAAKFYTWKTPASFTEASQKAKAEEPKLDNNGKPIEEV